MRRTSRGSCRCMVGASLDYVLPRRRIGTSIRSGRICGVRRWCRDRRSGCLVEWHSAYSATVRLSLGSGDVKVRGGRSVFCVVSETGMISLKDRPESRSTKLLAYKMKSEGHHRFRKASSNNYRNSCYSRFGNIPSFVRISCCRSRV